MWGRSAIFTVNICSAFLTQHCKFIHDSVTAKYGQTMNEPVLFNPPPQNIKLYSGHLDMYKHTGTHSHTQTNCMQSKMIHVSTYLHHLSEELRAPFFKLSVPHLA